MKQVRLVAWGFSRAIRRVAVVDDEGREVAATILGDWPLVL